MPSSRLSLFLVLLLIGLAACQPAETEQPTEAADEAPAEAPATPETPGGVVTVTAKEFSFTGPARMKSGWNTIRFANQGEQPHFLVFWRLPEDKTFGDWTAQVVTPFEEVGARYDAGEMSREEFMQELGGELPEWFLTGVEGGGGAGLTAPGMTSETTIHFEPGEYVMECYVRTPEGLFHNAEGMMRPLIVTEEASELEEPEADVEITLSNYELAVSGAMSAGENTVRVTVTEEPEGLLGHDVHLLRVQEGADLQEVAQWMDWVDSMRSPAPVEFLGGAEEMAPGHNAYFTVTLEPGRYAWMSEGYATRGMVREFTVE